MNTLLILHFAILLAVGAGVALVFHKARRVHLMLYDAERLAIARADNVFAQTEALLALYYDLRPNVSFPPTRIWAGSPDFLKHIVAIARSEVPVSIVECSSGTSTVMLALAARINGCGHVYSLEHDPKYSARTRTELARQGLDAFATVIDAPLVAHDIAGTKWQWYDTSSLPTSIDLLVIDGPPESIQPLARYPAVPLLMTRFSRDARIVLDDASRKDERIAVERWKAEFGLCDHMELHAEKGIACLRRGASAGLQSSGAFVTEEAPL